MSDVSISYKAEDRRKDRAISSLERRYAVKDGGLIAIRVSPFLDPLRSDPRFVALLRKMSFPA